MSKPYSILITQCFQSDFVRPLSRHEPLPNKLHIGWQESLRLLGPEPDQGPLAQLMYSARSHDEANLSILHIRDWHDSEDPAQRDHLQKFGPHCLRGTDGAKLVLGLDDDVSAHANERYIDALTLNDFEGTLLADTVNEIRDKIGDRPLRVGVVGVWTDAKVSFLCYDLLTRCGITDLGTCSALTASNRRTQHFNALEQLRRLLGVQVYESVGAFADWLLHGTATIALPPPPTGIDPEINCEGDFELTRADRDLVGYLYRDARLVVLTPMGGGFSGAGVYRTRSFDALGHEHAPTVLKIGDRDAIAQERTSLERIEAILGNDAPTLRGSADFGGRGALKFALAAMGNGAVKTFKSLYEDGIDDDEVARILAMVFEGILGRFSKVAHSEPIQHAQHWGFESRYAAGVTERVAALYGSDARRLQFPGGYEVPNPADFYADPLPALLRQPASQALVSWVHGDLNGANILVDERGNVWMIDFTHAAEQQATKDLLKLENDIMYIMTEVADEDALAQALLITRALRRVKDLRAELPHHLEGLRRPELQRCWRTIRILRKHVARICRDDRDPVRVAWGFLRYAVHTLTFEESDELQKRWALAAAGGWAEDISTAFEHNRRLRVDRIDQAHLVHNGAALTGRLGLTICPGRLDRNRSLTDDVALMKSEQTAHVVCLMTGPEKVLLGVEDLERTCRDAGVDFHWSPIVDQGIPGDAQAQRLVGWLLQRLAQGEDIVVHCMGGLGRSGTIVACVLRACGLDAGAAIAAVRDARGPRALEVRAQERFVHNFQLQHTRERGPSSTARK